MASDGVEGTCWAKAAGAEKAVAAKPRREEGGFHASSMLSTGNSGRRTRRTSGGGWNRRQRRSRSAGTVGSARGSQWPGIDWAQQLADLGGYRCVEWSDSWSTISGSYTNVPGSVRAAGQRLATLIGLLLDQSTSTRVEAAVGCFRCTSPGPISRITSF